MGMDTAPATGMNPVRRAPVPGSIASVLRESTATRSHSTGRQIAHDAARRIFPTYRSLSIYTPRFNSSRRIA
jgi:hypothetical protein